MPFNPNWIEQKTKVMEDILQAKAKCNPDFCEALITSHSVIAEAVPGDIFWSTGLNKEECLCVKKNHWPGQNRMGKLLSAIRDQLLQSKKKKKKNSSSNNDSGDESEYNYKVL